MSKQKIREWLDKTIYSGALVKNELADLIHKYTQEQNGWVSVDKVRLKVELAVPVARHEGPDYYNGYHQAREDILATLPPTEEA